MLFALFEMIAKPTAKKLFQSRAEKPEFAIRQGRLAIRDCVRTNVLQLRLLAAMYYICLSNNDLTSVLSWFVKQHQCTNGLLR